MTIHNSLSELIGNTPLVKLNHVTDGIKATIAVKVEYFNPGGSSKDRIAERIIDAAERSGELKPGGVIVEPTSGNTGVGLALVAQQRGYRTIFTLPDKVSEAKRAVLRAYGAEVVVTPTDAGPDDPRSYYQVAERLAKAIPADTARTNTTTRTDRKATTAPPVRKSGNQRPSGHAFRGWHRHWRHHFRHRTLPEGSFRRRSTSDRATRKDPSIPIRTTCISTASKAWARISIRKRSTVNFPTKSCRSTMPKHSK